MEHEMKRHQAVSLIAAGLTIPFVAPARADDTLVRVASSTFDVSGQIYYAQEMGFLKKAGLTNVVIQNFTSGPAIATAVAGNAADIGNANNVSLARAYHQNIPFRIVAPSGLYSSAAPTSVLMSAQNSPIKTAAQLSGKVIAVSGLGSLAQIASQAWVDKNGGQSASVKFVEMAQPDIIASIATGAIDAGLIIEPFVADAKARCTVLSDCFDAIAPSFMIGAYFAQLDWAKAHPDTVKRFHAAMAETALWANKNQERTADILVRIANLRPEDARRMNRIVYIPESLPKLLQPVVDATAKYSNFPTFAARDLIFAS
jgi:NitT/TauT family transport system substrate-binding protein